MPYYSQNGEPWGDDEYDAASNWASDPSIDKWGCALTSASMVLKYHGISQNPGSLNTWLKSQSDGYLRGGLLNWLALTRFSRISGATILEYRRAGNDPSVIDQDLEDGNPVILDAGNDPGSHFVVTNGKLDPNYSILDPEVETNTTASSFRSARRLLPTQTNLSALLLVFDNDLNMSGLTGGELNQELPLSEDSGETTSGDPVWTYLLNQPLDGVYRLVFTADNPGWYNFEIYGYDQDAEVQARQERIYLDEEGAVYEFNFSQVSGDLSEFHRQIGFWQMLEDINLAAEQGWFKNLGAWQSLTSIMRVAEKFSQKSPILVPGMLGTWERLAKSQLRIGLMTPIGGSFLLKELGYLRLSL